jgi:hypothetical protein
MDNLADGKRFPNLLEAVAADQAGPGRLAGNDATLGPCVGDDFNSPTTLGPCVGDDNRINAPSLTVLGPSVGDDNKAPPTARGLTMLGPSVGDDGAPPPSDIRLKHDVRCVGTTVFGLPLYHFKYIGRPETYEGVMAHEVLQVMPAAVSLGADGYHRVDYGALGTSMRRVS